MSDVDLIGATITVRDPKNKRDRVVAMSTRVHEILTGRRQEWEAEHQAGRVDVRVYGSKADICKPVKKVMKAAHIDQERRDFLHPVTFPPRHGDHQHGERWRASGGSARDRRTRLGRNDKALRRRAAGVRESCNQDRVRIRGDTGGVADLCIPVLVSFSADPWFRIDVTTTDNLAILSRINEAAAVGLQLHSCSSRPTLRTE